MKLKKTPLQPVPMALIDQFPLAFRLGTVEGPAHARFGVTVWPECPSSGQNFPDLHLEQLPFGGTSTALRNRPYFLRGMIKA